MRCVAVLACLAAIQLTLSTRLLAQSSDPPPIPKDARYTIICGAVEGQFHIERAKKLKTDLIKQTGLRDWYIVHGERESVVYFGYYRTFNDPSDPKESERVARDRERIAALKDELGGRLFRTTIVVDINSPDPIAPPEWNIANKDADKPLDDPTRAFYTIQIAVYKDHPLRKQYAVDAVREARKMGIDAYYFHGEMGSMVLIGAWPESAMIVENAKSIEARDSNSTLLVVPGRYFPKTTLGGLRDEDGNPVEAFADRVEIVDPTLRKAMQQFPVHSVNGEEERVSYRDPTTGELKSTSRSSILVEIPRRERTALQADTQTQRPTLVDPSGRPRNSNAGRLRGVED
jgi:hypothetical protein